AKLGVELKYQNVSDYLEESIFGDHECNLYDIVKNARENAIMARNYLPQDAFTAIIELYQLFKENENSLNQIDYNFIDIVLNIILRIWGAMHQFLQYQSSYDFIRLGRLVEKLDLSIRLNEQTEFSLLLIDDIDKIALRLNSAYQKEKLSGLTYSKMLDRVNDKINMIVTDTI
ncbi:MAG: alpha-E domain-containing protein, partial [Sulfurovum sp.]|nr:alpha-E domain-containing protein [Sulfurovum sp.]